MKEETNTGAEKLPLIRSRLESNIELFENPLCNILDLLKAEISALAIGTNNSKYYEAINHLKDARAAIQKAINAVNEAYYNE